MSLINQMLQDLDARRAAHGGETRFHDDVRPLPPMAPSRWPLVLVLIGFLAFAAGVAFYYWRSSAVIGSSRINATVPAAPQQKTTPITSLPVRVPAAEPAKPVVKSDQEPMPEVNLAMSEAIRQPPILSDTQPEQPAVTAKSVEAIKPTKPAAAPLKPLVPASDMASSAQAKEPVAALVTAVPPATASTTAATPAKASRPAAIERTDVAGTPPERAEAEYRKAIAAVNQGRLGEAQEGLFAALRADPFHAASRQLLVKLLLETRQADEAVNVLKEGLQGQPAQVGWAMSLARLQVERGDLAGAWQTLDRSAPAAAESADYQGFAGHVLLRLGRAKEAAERYREASRLAPGDGRWWLGLGLSLDAQGQSEDARAALLRAKQTGKLSAELMAIVDQKLR